MATHTHSTRAPAVERTARLIPTFLQLGFFGLFAALVAFSAEG